MSISIPDREWHQRALANGSTRYSYEAIIATLQEFEKCVNTNRALVAETIPILKPYDQWGTIGVTTAPLSIQHLNNLLDSKHEPASPSLGDRNSRETWPVAKWQALIRSYRFWNQRLRKAIDRCVLEGKIREAVWKHEIDQINTREVAERFECEVADAWFILTNLVRGTSGDDRFVINPERGERGGVLIEDGSTFNYAPMDLNEGGISTRAPKHFIWFCN